MAESPPLLRRLLAGWMAIAGRFGATQTRVLLGFLYFCLIGPFSLGARLVRSDFLDKRSLGSGGTAFVTVDSAPPDLERAKLTS